MNDKGARRVSLRMLRDVDAQSFIDSFNEGLKNNKAVEVHVFGRRGPAQAKFTPLELRELDHSPNIEVIVDPADIDYDEGSEAARRHSKQVDMVANTLEQWAIRDQGTRPHKLFLHFFESPHEILGEEGLQKGIRVKTSSYTRHHVNSTMPRAKLSATYPNSILANLEVTRQGYDEALLLDNQGFVAEGAGENLFIVKDGRIYEPEIASALTGITRDSIHVIARELGYEVGTKRLTRDDIYLADEAFFTGTAAEVTPIRELDDRKIGEGKRGPVTEKIQTRFFDVVNGRAPEYAHWLAHV